MGEIVYGRKSFGRNFRRRAKTCWAKFPGRKILWAILSMGENELGETSGGQKILGQSVDGRKKLGETTGAKHDWAKIPGANLPVTIN